MMNDKRFKIANRISFIFFALYFLTYIVLPIAEKNASYLIFFIFPCAFLVALIINLLIKYNKMQSKTMGKVSKVAAVANILLNGIIINSANVAEIDWSEKEKEIKKYPSITPTFCFIILFMTAFSNFAFFAIMQTDTTLYDPHFSFNVLLTYSIISIVFIFIAQISCTFALFYNNGKKETLKDWKTIAIVVLAFAIILAISAIPTIKTELESKQRKDEFHRHKQNIENVLNNQNNAYTTNIQ